MLRPTKMVKCLPEFEFVCFFVFLKYRNFISKIKRSKVTDYEALITRTMSKTKINKYGIPEPI